MPNLTPVEYIVAPESEECSGRAPGQEGWRQLGRRDVQVDCQQRNAQQAHKKPPFPHLSFGRRAGLAFRNLEDNTGVTERNLI
jgi:hypothetical protein